MNYVRTHSCQDLITQSCCHVKSACAKCGNSHNYIPLNKLCGFRGLINTNWIEVLVTIFYRRGTLNKLKFDLIKKHSSDLCKRNANKIWCLSFIVLVKIRRNFAKFRHEISSKHSRIFVKGNFAVILAKFRIHWSEISCWRNFVGAKIRTREILLASLPIWWRFWLGALNIKGGRAKAEKPRGAMIGARRLIKSICLARSLLALIRRELGIIDHKRKQSRLRYRACWLRASCFVLP